MIKISKIFLALGLVAIIAAPIAHAQSFEFLNPNQQEMVRDLHVQTYLQKGVTYLASQPRVAGAVSLSSNLTSGLISGLSNLLNQKTGASAAPTGGYTPAAPTQPTQPIYQPTTYTPTAPTQPTYKPSTTGSTIGGTSVGTMPPPYTQPGGTITTGGLNLNNNQCNFNGYCEPGNGENISNCKDCQTQIGSTANPTQQPSSGTAGGTGSQFSFRFGCTNAGQCQLDQAGILPEWYPDLMTCKARCVNKTGGVVVTNPGMTGGTPITPNLPGTTPGAGGSVTGSGITSNNPQVITKPATNITSNSATLNGAVVSLENCPGVEVAFELESSNAAADLRALNIERSRQGLPPATSAKRYIIVGTKTAIGDFSANATGLVPNTAYFYTAMARCNKEYPAPTDGRERDLSREIGWIKDGQMNFTTLTGAPVDPTSGATGETKVYTTTYKMINPLFAQLSGKAVNGLALAAKARDKMAFCGFIVYTLKESPGIKQMISAPNPPLVEHWIAHPLKQVPAIIQDFTFETQYQAFKPDPNNTSTDPFATDKCFRAYCRASYYPDPTIPAIFGEEMCISKDGPTVVKEPTKTVEPTQPTTPDTQSITLLDASNVIKAVSVELVPTTNALGGKVTLQGTTDPTKEEGKFIAKGKVLTEYGGRVSYWFYSQGASGFSDKELVAQWKRVYDDWAKIPDTAAYKSMTLPGNLIDRAGDIQSNQTPVTYKSGEKVCAKIGLMELALSADEKTIQPKFYISNEVCTDASNCIEKNGKKICGNLLATPDCRTSGVPCAETVTLPACKQDMDSVECQRAARDFSIRSIEKPEVQTLEVGGVTTNSMTITGSLVKLGGNLPWGGESLLGKFNTYVAFSGSGKSNFTPKQKMAAPGTFSYTVSELRPGTSYCWTAVAWNIEEKLDIPAPANLVANFDAQPTGPYTAYGQAICATTKFGDTFEKKEEEIIALGYKTSLAEFGVDWNGPGAGTSPLQVGAAPIAMGAKRDGSTMYGFVRKTDLSLPSIAPIVSGFAFTRGQTMSLGGFGGSNTSGQTYFVIANSGMSVTTESNFEYKLANMTAGSSFTYYPFAIYNGKLYKGSYGGTISAAADNSVVSPDLKTLENGKVERSSWSGYYKAELKGQVIKVGTTALGSMAVGFEIVSPDDTSLGANYRGFVQGIKAFSYPGDISFVFDRARSGYKYCYKTANNSVFTGKTNYAAEEFCFTAPKEDDWKPAEIPVLSDAEKEQILGPAFATPEKKCYYCKDGVATPAVLQQPLGASYYAPSDPVICATDGNSYRQKCFNYYCLSFAGKPSGIQLKSTGKCVVTDLAKQIAKPTGPANISAVLIRPETTQWNEVQSTKQRCGFTDRGAGVIRITIKVNSGSIKVPVKGAFIASNYSGGIFVKNVDGDSIKYTTGAPQENGYYILSQGMYNFTIDVGIDPHPTYSAGVRTFAQLVSMTYIDGYSNSFDKISFDNTYQTIGIAMYTRQSDYRLVKFGEEFCGLNAGGNCAKDDECVQQGLYQQICVARSAMNTACIAEDGYRNCWFNQSSMAANYVCKCVDTSQTLPGNVFVRSGKCAWTKSGVTLPPNQGKIYPEITFVSQSVVKKDNSSSNILISDTADGTIMLNVKAVGGDIYIKTVTQADKGIDASISNVDGSPADPIASYTYACATGCDLNGATEYIVREGKTATFAISSMMAPSKSAYYYTYIKSINWRAGLDQLPFKQALSAQFKTSAIFLVYRTTAQQSTSTNPTDNCACTADYNPVCGTNGKTYSNECVAKCDDVAVKYKGECIPEEAPQQQMMQTMQNNLTADPVVANLPWDSAGTKMAGTITLNRFANTGAYVGFIKTTMPMYGVGSIKVETVYWPNPPKIFTKDNGTQFEIAVTKPSYAATICYDAFVRMGNYYKKAGLQKCRTFR